MDKKLYRSRYDRMLSGVCGGSAQYWNIDSTIVRLIFVFLWLATGILPLTAVYFVAVLVIPLEKGKKKKATQRFFYRSKEHRMIGGICGALAESWDIDPTIVRLGAVILCLVTGVLPLIVVYLVGWFVIPEK